jgi:hypothetical protein
MAGLIAAALLAGCGGNAPSEPQGLSGVGPVSAGSQAQYADCEHWNSGTAEDKLATIADIRGQLTPQDSRNSDSGYPDEAALELFDRVCSYEFAAKLRLYKLYARAAAFAPLRSDG